MDSDQFSQAVNKGPLQSWIYLWENVPNTAGNGCAKLLPD